MKKYLILFILLSLLGACSSSTDNSSLPKETEKEEEKTENISEESEPVKSTEEIMEEYDISFNELNTKCIDLYNNQQYQEIVNEINSYKKEYPDYSYYLKRYKAWLVDDIVKITKLATEPHNTEEILFSFEYSVRPYPVTETYEEEVFWQNIVTTKTNELYSSETSYNIHKNAYRESQIIREEPHVGMTADEVRESTWGRPQKINKTTTKYGVDEQWVYPNYKYIYLEDGIVTAIQE